MLGHPLQFADGLLRCACPGCRWTTRIPFRASSAWDEAAGCRQFPSFPCICGPRLSRSPGRRHPAMADIVLQRRHVALFSPRSSSLLPWLHQRDMAPTNCSTAKAIESCNATNKALDDRPTQPWTRSRVPGIYSTWSDTTPSPTTHTAWSPTISADRLFPPTVVFPPIVVFPPTVSTCIFF